MCKRYQGKNKGSYNNFLQGINIQKIVLKLGIGYLSVVMSMATYASET